MVGRKGFIHVVEAVLISVVAIALIPSLLRGVHIKEKWTRTNLERMGEDILTSLHKSGELEKIMSYNRTEVRRLFEGGENSEGVLGARSNFIQYNMKTEHAYKSRIWVGFNCTGCDPAQKKREIQKILKPVWLNGRFIRFHVFPFSWNNFTGAEKNYKINVIFLKGDEQAEQAKNCWGNSDCKDGLKNHLSRGNGIVEYADLGGIDPSSDFQSEVFGLANGSSGSENLTFANRANVSKPNYEPSKLFYGVGSSANTSGMTNTGKWTIWKTDYNVTVEDVSDGYNVTVSDGQTYCDNCKVGENFSINNNEFVVEKVKEMESGIWSGQTLVWFRHLEEPEKYKFVNFVGGKNVKPANDEWSRSVLNVTDSESGFIINESSGRTAWVSQGRGDDVKGLVQSAVIWSAERGKWNFLRSPGRGAVTARQYVVNSREIYEPYEVILTLWYIY